MSENKNPQPTNLVYRVVENRYGINDRQIVKLQCENPQAAFAMDLMKHLGICAGRPDGEDSTGRQKGALLSPDEVVTRACSIADIAWQEFQKRGWILDIPVTPKKEEPA